MMAMTRLFTYISVVACLLFVSCKGDNDNIFTSVTVSVAMPQDVEVLSVVINMRFENLTDKTITTFNYTGQPVRLKLLKGLYGLTDFAANIKYTDGSGITTTGTLDSPDENSKKFEFTADTELVEIATKPLK